MQPEYHETPRKSIERQQDKNEIPPKRVARQSDVASIPRQAKRSPRQGFSKEEGGSMHLTVHDWGSGQNVAVRGSFGAFMYDSQPKGMHYPLD